MGALGLAEVETQQQEQSDAGYLGPPPLPAHRSQLLSGHSQTGAFKLEFVIESRFNGPDESGNGGIAAGSLAQYLPGITEVRLDAPPPLDTPLGVVEDRGQMQAVHNDQVVMTAYPATPKPEGPPPVSWEEAKEAEQKYEGFNFHGAPSCFVCGPNRLPNDGLRIFPGPIEGTDLVAATWIPNQTLANPDGAIPDVIIWGALDCPGAWAAITSHRSKDHYFPALGLMTLTIDSPIEAGRKHVITARLLEVEGRKLMTDAALYTIDGQQKAAARHTEIKLPADWAVAD